MSSVARVGLVLSTFLAFAARVDAAPPEEPLPPLLSSADMAELGWTLSGCLADPTSNGCAYVGPNASTLNVLVSPLRPIDDLDVALDTAMQMFCAGGSPLDVGDRVDTVGCQGTIPELGTQVYVFFGNAEWQFTLMSLSDLEPTPAEVDALLAVRDAQLDAAGGERSDDSRPDTGDASALDRFLPDSAPAGFYPPQGITTDFPTLDTSADDEVSLPPSTYDFLERRSLTRGRMWLHNDGYGMAVQVTEYPYEVLAGLALGALDEEPYTPIDTPALDEVKDLRSVQTTGTTDGVAVVIEGFRRGRYDFRVLVAGPDVQRSAALASEAVLLVDELAPTSGATAPVHPPSALTSLLQATLVTAGVIVGAMILGRLLGGRARRAPPLREPAPVVEDVSARAAELRRDGRVLAVLQVVACAIIVIGLVADVGWWWPVVVLAGVAFGLLATGWARQREQGRTTRNWSLNRPRVWIFGTVGAVLILVGVALAIRALKELVLLPSLTHLRLAERYKVTPSRLSLAMALAAVGLLVIGAILLRRGRAYAKSTHAHGTAGRGDTILYLRSFDDDHLSVPSVHSARRPFFELFGLRGRDPFEEGIAWELASHGTLTAVGRPGGSTVSLGASRDLLPQDGWQSTVAERMDAARYVVVSIGTTQGLAWELHTLTTHGHLGKCIFLVPPCATEEVEARWLATRAAVDEAGGRTMIQPVEVVGTLTLHVNPRSGHVTSTRSERIDEAGYRAAIECALDGIIRTGAEAQSALPAPLPPPVPSV